MSFWGHVRASSAATALLASISAGWMNVAAAQSSPANPPAIVGDITAPFPGGEDSVIVNLRQQGAIAGTAPLMVIPRDVYINGEFTEGVGIYSFPGETVGVCLWIDNFSGELDSEDTLEVDLEVYNLAQQTATARVSIVNGAAPTVNPDNQADVDACLDPNSPPTVNAGADQNVIDSDGVPGEPVPVSASAVDPDADALSYSWVIGETTLATGATAQLDLDDGTTTVTLVVEDGYNVVTDAITITVNAPSAPQANAGEDQTLQDSDAQPGEEVTLDASGSSDADGTIATYIWTDDNEQQLATGANPTIRLDDGQHTLFLQVIDNVGLQSTDSVQILVNPASAPVVDAGENRTIQDSDSAPGESVTLTGTATDEDGTIANYEWFLGEQSLGEGSTITTPLPDGENVITLQATDNAGNVGTDTVTITVVMPVQLPQADAGPDQTVADSDREAGESVTLDGSGSSDPNGQSLTYAWARLKGESSTPLGAGSTLTVSLPDGVNTIRLTVTDPDGNQDTDTVQVTVASPPERPVLADLPNLSKNQRSVALALDRVCAQLDDMNESEAALTEDQQELLERCDSLLFDSTAAQQTRALGALVADDFAAARTQTLLFSNALWAGVMDRLVALRGGTRGLSLAGLNIMVDGKMVPLAQLRQMAGELLGGGASSDADEPGGLLSDKWGVWARGNYSTGEKDDSPSSPSFKADQWALLGGVDYRLSEKAVLGISMAYGESELNFNPAGEGGLDTTSWAASAYGSFYAAKSFYVDAIANVANSDYAAERNIAYVDGSGLVSADASGTTDGITWSGGVSGGYDLLFGRLTVSPTLGVFYIDATIDSFVESGAGGFNLIYDEQNFKSLTGNLGLRMTLPWNHSWGVLLPHLRIDHVREFENDVDVFGVRFASDPNAASTPPILVETDNPDRSYWRLAGGLSAQFRHGVSGYVEYQRLESFEFISFEDVSFGLRFQTGF